MRRKTPIVFLIIAFLVNTIGSVPTQASELFLPNPGTMVHLSPEYNPLILKGVKINPKNPFQFDFILDQGDSFYAGLSSKQFKTEATRLVKYFLASLTIPENELWVNLSPYEKNRIVPNNFGRTEMGRDLLGEDYILKQITASLIYPEDELGKKFWKQIYEEAIKKFGTTNIPVNTFNKVWIIPDKAVVYENAKTETAFVVESKLKVMLEQDYLALNKSTSLRGLERTAHKDVNALGSQVIRELIIPELTKEVNENKNFAHLRQVYSSLILASWYKKKIRDSILAHVYLDKRKVKGIEYDRSIIRSPSRSTVNNANDTDLIYKSYLKAFKKGVYNYIKEEVDIGTNQIVPRKYFSGGMMWGGVSKTVEEQLISGPDAAQTAGNILHSLRLLDMTVGLSADFSIGDAGSQAPVVKKLEQITGRSFTDSGFQKLVHKGVVTLQGNKYKPSELRINLDDLNISANRPRKYQQRERPHRDFAQLSVPFNFQEELEIIQQARNQEDKSKDKLNAYNRILTAISKDELYLSPSVLNSVINAWNIILADIVNGKLDLNDPQVLSSVVNSVLELNKTGNGAFIRERISAYHKLLAPPNRLNTSLSPQTAALEIELNKIKADLTQEKFQRIYFLLEMMERVYLALEPLEAINKLEILPFQIRSESNVEPKVSREIANKIVNAQKTIEETLSKLSWDWDALFSNQPTAIKIINQNIETTGHAVAYNLASNEIQIAQNALSLEQNDFNQQLQDELRRALVQRIVQTLVKELGLDTDAQNTLQETLSEIAENGKSLSEFILFCNMNDQLSLENVTSFLDDVKNGELDENELYRLVGHDKEIIEETIAVEEQKTASNNRFIKAFGNFISYLREHPALALIPLALIAAAGSTYAADFNHPGGGLPVGPHPMGNVPQVDFNTGHPSLEFNHVLSLGSRGVDVTKIGTVLMDQVKAEDIKNLTGNNSVTGRPYDTQYLSRNAERIIQGVQRAVQQGVLNTDVQTIVVAYQRAHHLEEDGSIGIHVINELNSSNAVPSASAEPPLVIKVQVLQGDDSIAKLFEKSPEIQKIQANLDQSHQLNVNDLIQYGKVLINGQSTIERQSDLILPNDVVSFIIDMGSSVTGAAAAPPSGGPPPPITNSSPVLLMPVPGANQMPAATTPSQNTGLLAQALALNSSNTSTLLAVHQKIQQLMVQVKNPNISAHDRQMIENEIGISSRYEALMKQLYSGPVENQPYRVIYSIKPGEEYKPLRIFDTEEEFTEFMARFSTEGRFFKVLAPQQGPLEISKLFDNNTFKEVTSIKEIEQMTDDGIHYFAYAAGKDLQGQFDGIVAGGVHSALDKVEFMEAVGRSANLLNEINQSISIPTSNGKGLIVGAYIARDKYGLIQQNIKFITRDDIKEDVMQMPDGTSRVVMWFNTGGRSVVLKSYNFTNSPYEEFSLMQPEEEALLKDPQKYKMVFDSDNYSSVNRLSRGEIILGDNWKTIEENKLHLMRAAATKNENLNELALRDAKRRGLLQFLLAPANIALGAFAPNVPVPLNAAADLLYRVFHKSPISELGAPTTDEIAETELGPWLLGRRQSDDSSYMQGRAWKDLTEAERSNLKAEAVTLFQNVMPEQEVEKLYHYLEVRQKQGKQSYLLDTVSSILNVAGTLEGGLDAHLTVGGVENKNTAGSYLIEYKSPNNKALAFLLGNAGWLLTGQVPVPQAIAAAMGKPMPFIAVNKLGNPGSFVDKVAGYLTPVIDLKSVINGFVSDPTKKPFVNSPTSPRLNIYIAGIDLKEILYALHIDERLEQKLKEIYEDPANYGYITKDHLVTSEGIGLKEDAIEGLFYKASSIKVPLTFSVNGVNVPIYLLVNPDTKKYQILILTKAGIDAKLKIIEKQHDNDRQFMNMFADSGVREDVAPQGGTLSQRSYNGLRRSFGGETGFADFSFTWDDIQSNYVYMATGQRTITDETLQFFKNRFDDQIKVYGKFVGIPNLYFASNGTNAVDQGDVGATSALILQLINYREHYNVQDQHLDKIINAMTQWLISKQEGNGGFKQNNTEPLEVSALAYSAFARTGHLAQANHVLSFAKANMDPQTGLLKNNPGGNGLTADATLRWFAALGAEGTLAKLYDNDTGRYINAWRNFINKFELKDGVVDKYYSDRHVLIDNGDETIAAGRRQTGERIGDTEVTANTIGRLREHQTLLNSLGETWVQSSIDQLTQELKKFQGNRMSIPASTAPGDDTGLGFEYPQGRDSLAAESEIMQSVNASTPINPLRGDLQGTLSPVPMPADALSKKAQTTNTFTAGDSVRSQMIDLEDKLQERDRLEKIQSEGRMTSVQQQRLDLLKQEMGDTRLDWVNSNNREFSFVKDGVLKHVVIFDSYVRITNAEQLTRQESIDAQNYSKALSGQGPYPSGAVTLNYFTRQNNQLEMEKPILNDQGSKFHGNDMEQKVFQAISKLPVAERQRILSKQYANFILKMDIGTGNQPNVQEVMVTVIFPIDKDIIDTISTDNDIDVYRNGKLKLKITPDEIVVPSYNNLKIQVNAIKYQNPKSYENRPADIEGYVAQIQTALRDGHLPEIGGSVTYDYHYIDPHTIETLNPNTVRERVLVSGYDGSLALESYGLFTQYVKRVTVNDISEPQRDDFGYVKSEKVHNNGREETLPTLTLPQSIERMANPVEGKLVTENTADLNADHRTTDIHRHNVIHDTFDQMTIDNVHGGRKIDGSTVDVLVYRNGQVQRINGFTRYLYSPQFHYGYIPYASLLYSKDTGKLLTTIVTSNFDPLTRRITGEATDHTKGNAKTTFVWDWRWEAPVVERNSLRTTNTSYDRNETNLTATTTTNNTGELISSKKGTYNLAGHQWIENTTLYYQYINPGSSNNIPLRNEIGARSANGHLIEVDVDHTVRSIPHYDSNGVEIGRSSWLFKNGAYTEPFHTNSGYTWSAGNLTETVDAGKPLEHRESFDIVGRSTAEVYGNNRVRVNINKKYEGSTERINQTVASVNGLTRYTVSYGTAHQDATHPSYWILPSTQTPYWGLRHTEDYRIGDVFGRPFNIIYENGSRVIVDEWERNSNIPFKTHTVNHNGRTIATTQSSNFTHQNGLILMPAHNTEISFFGTTQETGYKAFIAGTSIPYYSFDLARQENTYFDMRQAFEAPFFTQDTTGKFNVPVLINGQVIPVTAVHWATLGTYTSLNNKTPEKVMDDTKVGFDGRQQQTVESTVFDKGGNKLEVKAGSFIAPVKGGYNYKTIQGTVKESDYISKHQFTYDGGRFIHDGGTYRFDGTTGVVTPNTVNNGTRDMPIREIVYQNQNPTGGIIRPGNSTFDWLPVFEQRNPVYYSNNTWASKMPSPWWLTKDKVTFTINKQGKVEEVNKMSTRSWTNNFGNEVFTFNTGFGLNEQKLRTFNYNLPKQSPILLSSLKAVPAKKEMGPAPVPALKGNHFLYFYSNGLEHASGVKLILTDSNGRHLEINSDQSSPVKFWTPADINKMFIATAKDPQQIITVESSRVDMRDKNLWVVSIPQIIQSGAISLEGQLTASWRIEGNIGPNAVVSPIGVLGDGGQGDLTHVQTTKVKDIVWASNGDTVTIHAEDPQGRGSSIIESVGPFSSQPVASSADAWEPSGIGKAFTKSSQDPELTVFKDPARPNIAVSFWRPSGNQLSGILISYKDEHNGSFVFRFGARNGFESPRTMDFQLSYIRGDLPKNIAYGATSDDIVVFPMGANILAANMNANIFNRITDIIRGRVNPDFELSEAQKQFIVKYTQAGELAKIIKEFPLANEANVDPRPFWEEKPSNLSPVAPQRASIQINGQGLKGLLQNMVAQKKEGDLPLLPTALGTYVSTKVDTTEYVETPKELDYIVPALIHLGMVREATQIIQFYLEKSQNGLLPIADSYSRKTGQAILYNSYVQNAAPAPKSASSQIAFINNLLFLAKSTNDRTYLAYAETALDHLLMVYNPSLHNSPTMSLSDIRGGITEQKANLDKKPIGSVKLLPVNPDSFSTVDNAKFYLLLQKILKDPQLKGPLSVKAGILEPLQKDWLKSSGLFARLHGNFQAGLVPDSYQDLYDLQGVPRSAANNPKLLGENPWATFESSRYVLEAALAAKEISPKELSDLINNISRYYHREVSTIRSGHSVKVDGFDAINRPIGRQDVIVPQNTAEMLYLAKLTGNQRLVNQLKAVMGSYPLVNGLLLPEIITEIPPNQEHKEGLGIDAGFKFSGNQYRYLPSKDNTSWPGSLTTTIEDYFAQNGLSTYSPSDKAMISAILAVSSGYIALKTLSVLVPKAIYNKKREMARLMAKGKYTLSKMVYSSKLRETADKRFEEKVLRPIKDNLNFEGSGAIKPRQLQATVLSEAHVEGLFLFHANLIRYLAAERVRRENNWSDNDSRLLGDNPYLNSIDELMEMMFVFMRQEIANGDDIQIQGKMEVFLQNYYLRLKQLLNNNDYEGFDRLMREISGNFGQAHPQDKQFKQEIAGGQTQGAITYKYTDHLGITPLMKLRFTHDFYAKYEKFVKKERITSISPSILEIANYFDRFLLTALTSIFSMGAAFQNINPITALATSFVATFGMAGIIAAGGTALAVLGAVVLEIKAQFNHARPSAIKARILGIGLLSAAGILGYSMPALYFEVAALKWLIVSSLAVEGLSLAHHKLLIRGYALLKDLVHFIPRIFYMLIHGNEYKKDIFSIGSYFKYYKKVKDERRSPHSLFGLSLYFHLKPAITMGPWYMLTNYLFYLPLTLAIAAFAGQEFNIYNWFSIRYLGGEDLKVFIGALTYVILIQYLAPYSIFGWITAVFSAGRTLVSKAIAIWNFKVMKNTLSKRIQGQINVLKTKLKGEKIAIMNYGGNSIVSPVFLLNSVPKATEEILKSFDVLKANGDKSPKITMSREQAEDILNALHTAEQNQGKELFQLIQLNNTHLSEISRFMVTDPIQADKVAQGYRLRLYLSEVLGATQNMDIAANLVAKAIEVRKYGIGDNVLFLIGHNKYDAPPSANSPSQVWKTSVEIESRDRLAILIREISGNAEVQYVHTHFGQKSGGMNSLFLARHFNKIRYFFVEDRQSTVSDMLRWFSDLTKIVTDDNLAIIIADRNTSYMYHPVGQSSFLVEQGFISVGPQKVSTGWGTMQKATYEESMNMHAYEDAPVMPLTGATTQFQKETGLGLMDRIYNNFFGILGFTPNAPGQSEDYQSLLATVHTMIAMGANPKYAISEARWFKKRETNNMGPWSQAPVRWSAGRVGTIDDYLMQNINELGPESSFARDYNINQGRFYINMPVAMLTITLAPLLVYFDLTPFQGIQGLFWSFGFGAAHVSILHGILATLRHRGYNQVTGIIGAGIAGAVCFFSGMPVTAVGMTLASMAGLISGGFIVGISQSISNFFRDKILFSNRISVEHGGQLKGHEGITHEFKLSNSGGDSDTSPFASLGIFYNQKQRKVKIFSSIDDETGKHVIDGGSINHSIFSGVRVTLLNILVMLKLDLMNVTMLLPSLVFTTGMMVGPIMMKKKIGKDTVFGTLFKIIGFMEGGLFLGAISLLARANLDQGDKNLVVGSFLVAGIANIVPLIRSYIGWTRYRDIPEKNIDLPLLGKSFNYRSLLKEAIKKYPNDRKKAVSVAVANALNNAKESGFAKWLFLGKWARMTSEQARGFWMAIVILGWFAIVPLPPMFVVSFAEYKFAIPINDVVKFLGNGTAGIVFYLILGKLVEAIQNWYWQGKINKLHETIDDDFGPRYKTGNYTYRQNEIENLMAGMDKFMLQKSIPLVRQSYNDVQELMKSGDQREVFNTPSIPAPLAQDKAMQAESRVVNPIKIDFRGVVQPAFDDSAITMARQIINNIPTDRIIQMGDSAFANPGGIDLGRTMEDVQSYGDFIQTAFDDPTMLRLLLNSDGLTPIIYNVKVMTPSMVDHFVGLN